MFFFCLLDERFCEDDEHIHRMFSIFAGNPNLVCVELCAQIKPQFQCSLCDVVEKLFHKTMKLELCYVEITI